MKKKVLFLITTLFFLAPALNCKTPPAQRLKKSDMSILRGNTDILVIVHSRSGNTAEAGMAISESLNADYLRLEVDSSESDYYTGAPFTNDIVEFKPATVDLSKYRLIFLGSPIWLYNPTAYIYSFVKSHYFKNKKIVLFYTFRGGLGDDAVNDFKELVSSRNGKLIDSFGVNEKELAGETIKSRVLKIVNKKKEAWAP